MNESYLDIVEQAHRERVGSNNFCYTPTHWHARKWWRLSVVERHHSGHYPVSEDFFVGTEMEAERLANELNSRRLDILPREAALIVASSMQGSLNDRRRGEQW